MTTEKFTIAGMSCNHCVMAVKQELAKLEGITAEVGVGTATVTYDETTMGGTAIITAINEAGYEVAKAEPA